jgi:hypothetical protein
MASAAASSAAVRGIACVAVRCIDVVRPFFSSPLAARLMPLYMSRDIAG